MANDKKNTKELASNDDDPTSEFEASKWRRTSADACQEIVVEAEADTFDIDRHRATDGQQAAAIEKLKFDLQSRSETIDQLQFDVEALHSKWLGLATELKAREDLTGRLTADLENMRAALARKDELLQERDLSIGALKSEIFEQDLAHRKMTRQSGQLASRDMLIEELRAQIQRTETYADGIRQQLHDRIAAYDDIDSAREVMESLLAEANSQMGALTTALDEEERSNTQLREQLDTIQNAHEKEIRMIRFELGEAQETVAQHELINEQLASDLVDTRGFKNELERMLTESAEQKESRIAGLEKEIDKLKKAAEQYEQKLSTKSEAINCLLSELSKKTGKAENSGEPDGDVHEIDDPMPERFDDRPASDRDRVTRVLIGSVDGQDLRFPLFKDRLTIGRSQQNDIQLKAPHVSRRHAVVVTEGASTRVIDWGSRNGVYVNSGRITEHFLASGDVLTIGSAEFRYEERPKRDS